MRKKLILLLIFLFIAACSTDNEKESIVSVYDTKHYNLIIAPDLSNRIDQKHSAKPVTDTAIIFSILNNIDSDNKKKNLLQSFNRSEDQKDRFSFSFINKQLISTYNTDMGNLSIDFSRFDTQLARIEYVKGYKEESLGDDIHKFKTEIEHVYSKAERNYFGADIWSYFKGLNSFDILSKTDTVTYLEKKYVNSYKNILVLLTDGYIEAGLYGKKACSNNQCYYLSSGRIKAFRKAYTDSGMGNMEEFFYKNEYGIIPINNPLLADLEVLVIEVKDRSIDPAGNATVFPTDFDIIKLFWTDWMEKSNVKKFSIKPAFASKKEGEQEMLEFITQ